MAWKPRPAEPYGPGNTASVKHGSRSARLIAPIADRLETEIAAVAPWTSAEAFAHARRAWAEAEARCELLRDFLARRGLLDSDGLPNPALAALERAEATAARRRNELGLTPRGWAALFSAMTSTGEDALGTLEAVKAQGRKMLALSKAGDS
jgi:hypothetical protein